MKTNRILVFTALVFGVITTACSQQYPIGSADYYSDTLHGKSTANGEIYDKNKMTAAHLNLPFGTMVRVTDHRTGRYVDVRINDRTSDWNKVIVLSRAAAQHLGVIGAKRDQISIAKLANGSDATLVAHNSHTTNFSTGGTKAATAPIPANYQFGHQSGNAAVANHQPSGALFPAGCPRCLAEQAAIEQRDAAKKKQNAGNHTQAYSTNSATNTAGGDFYEPFASTRTPAAPVVKQTPAAPALVAKAPAPVKAAAPQTVGNGYRIQFGAFRSSANARRLADQLTRSGVQTEVSSKDRRGNYRVLTSGAFSGQADALNWVSDFKRTGLTTEVPIVVR